MQKSTRKVMAALCGAGMLTACASPEKLAAVKIVPKMSVSNSHESAEAYYAIGRYRHGSQRFDDALKAYRRALTLDKDHVQANNAIGVLYAERGDYGQAVAFLRHAAELAPGDSQLFSNLGYALFLKGDYDAAVAALEKATSLDPDNSRAWNNYGRVMEKMGQPDRARSLFVRAQAVKAGHATAEKRPDGGTASFARDTRHGSVPSDPERGASDAFPRSRRSAAGVEAVVRQVGPGLYEIRYASIAEIGEKRHSSLDKAVGSSPSAASRNPAPEPVAPERLAGVLAGDGSAPTSGPADRAAEPVRAAKVEISNGNGINGMARSVGSIIGGGQLQVVRLANQRPFNVAVTSIEYVKQHEAAARGLAMKFGQNVTLKLNSGMRNVDIRLVLGRDLTNVEQLRERFLDRTAMAEKRD